MDRTAHRLTLISSELQCSHLLQRTERDFIFLPPPSSPSPMTLAPSYTLPTSLAAERLLSSLVAAHSSSLSRSRAELAAAISIFKLAIGVKGVPGLERGRERENLLGSSQENNHKPIQSIGTLHELHVEVQQSIK